MTNVQFEICFKAINLMKNEKIKMVFNFENRNPQKNALKKLKKKI